MLVVRVIFAAVSSDLLSGTGADPPAEFATLLRRTAVAISTVFGSCSPPRSGRPAPDRSPSRRLRLVIRRATG
jgi:hypothetical protein